MTLAEFREGVVVRIFDHGKMGRSVRVDHPAMPGLPVIGHVEAGLPATALDETRNRCINALFKDFTDLQEWSIL